MEGKNWGEFEECKSKLENKCNKLLIRWQKKKHLRDNKAKSEQKY